MADTAHTNSLAALDANEAESAGEPPFVMPPPLEVLEHAFPTRGYLAVNHPQHGGCCFHEAELPPLARVEGGS